MSTWTVIGIWDNDVPYVVGIISGQHDVQGEADPFFDQGVWATYADADSVEAAETIAVDEMLATLDYENNIADFTAEGLPM